MSDQQIIVTGFSPITFTGTVTKHVTTNGKGEALKTRNDNPFTIVEVSGHERTEAQFSFPVWEGDPLPEVGFFGTFHLKVDNRGRMAATRWDEVEVADDAQVV